MVDLEATLRTAPNRCALNGPVAAEAMPREFLPEDLRYNRDVGTLDIVELASWAAPRARKP
jgi:hypothetical protein